MIEKGFIFFSCTLKKQIRLTDVEVNYFLIQRKNEGAVNNWIRKSIPDGSPWSDSLKWISASDKQRQICSNHVVRY